MRSGPAIISMAIDLHIHSTVLLQEFSDLIQYTHTFRFDNGFINIEGDPVGNKLPVGQDIADHILGAALSYFYIFKNDGRFLRSHSDKSEAAKVHFTIRYHQYPVLIYVNFYLF